VGYVLVMSLGVRAGLGGAAMLVLAACSGPVNLTVSNPCGLDIRVQTLDGTIDAAGAWIPDSVPLADFVVSAGDRTTVKDALMFVTYPEEIRLVEPIERSFLVSACEDWTVPAEYCTAIET
jgi:hypothetical protein